MAADSGFVLGGLMLLATEDAPKEVFATLHYIHDIKGHTKSDVV